MHLISIDIVTILKIIFVFFIKAVRQKHLCFLISFIKTHFKKIICLKTVFNRYYFK